MKKILACLMLCYPMLLFSQVSRVEVKCDATVAENLCNQYLAFETVSKQINSKLNPGIAKDLGESTYNMFQKDFLKHLRFEIIHDYMMNEVDVISFNSYADKLIESFINKLNQKYESAAPKLGPLVSNVPNTNPFIIKLKEKYEDHGYQMRGPGDPCTNPDFEMCNFTNWILTNGQVPYPSPGPYSFNSLGTTTTFGTINTYGGSATDQHYICTGGTDGIGGFPMVYPGGTCSAEIGNFTGYNNGASQISQTFLVSASDAILILNYAVCLEDAGHTAAEQPYFIMRVLDQNGVSIPCAAYQAVAGDGQPGWVTSGAWRYKPWSTVFVPLAPYVGQNVTVQFTVGDCAQGGHAGYAYVDASCSAMAFNMSASAVCAGQPITITGPPGAASYLWSTGATTQSITTSTPGSYSVTVTPVTGSSCAITLDTVVMASPNPIANFSSTSPVCVGTPITFTDLSNPNGSTIGTWAWNFGDGQTSNLQNPSHTYAAAGNYNVTLTVTSTAGCTNAITLPVSVTSGGSPVITAAGPFCSTNPAVNLSATPAGGTWSATCGACINSSTGQFNPASATIGNNTITYTIAGACGGSDTEVIAVQSVTLTSITPTHVSCFGNCNGQIVINATGATQYSIDNGATYQASNTFTGLCPGNYSIVIRNALGCQATGNTTITQPTQLTLPTSFINETCFQSCDGVAIVAPQGGTSPYSYAWSNGGGNVPTINGLCSGNYTVTVTDNNSCTQNAVITISGPPQLTISNIATTMESCQGACDGSITITAPSATQFSINGGLTFQASNIFLNQCSGNYAVVVQDANGCQATGNAVVSAPNPMALTISNDTTICIGGTAQLSASVVGGTNPTTLIWNNGLPNGSNQTVSPVVNTTYSVFAQDANGCVTPPQQITVSINPPLTVIAFLDTAICIGASATITAQASGGNGGPYTYSWNDGNGNTLNGQTQLVAPSATTTYTVTVTDNCGTPSANDQVTITVNPLPVVSFIADTLQGCTPVAVNFTNTTNPLLTGNCLWNFGDGTSSNNCTPSHVFTTPGCYDITLTVTSPSGCVGSFTQNQYICVFPYPVANFSFGPQPANILDPQINFTNTSSGAISYEWDFAGLGTSTLTNPSFVFPDNDPANYLTCLAVENQYTCRDSICKLVKIDDYFTIYVPNAFTADGDGINDLFFAVVDGIDPTSFELMVFDRWGELIFSSNDPNRGWDGTYRGEKCKQDVYVWKIKLKDAIQHKKRTYYGHVSLLR